MTSFYFYCTVKQELWCHISCIINLLHPISGALSIQPKYPQVLIRNQMERTISVRSDRNIWDKLWRWFTLTSPLISVGPTEKSLPFDKIVVPSTALLYPSCSRNNKQTRGGLERICETGMNFTLYWARGIFKISNQNFCWMESAAALGCLFQVAITWAF